MLEGAATADAEVRAAGNHTVGGGCQDLDQLGLIMLTVRTGPAELYAFAGKRAGNESRLTVANDALARVSERSNCRHLDSRGSQPLPAQAVVSHARRNSAKCGSLPARSSTFTRSTSSA